MSAPDDGDERTDISEPLFADPDDPTAKSKDPAPPAVGRVATQQPLIPAIPAPPKRTATPPAGAPAIARTSTGTTGATPTSTPSRTATPAAGAPAISRTSTGTAAATPTSTPSRTATPPAGAPATPAQRIATPPAGSPGPAAGAPSTGTASSPSQAATTPTADPGSDTDPPTSASAEAKPVKSVEDSWSEPINDPDAEPTAARSPVKSVEDSWSEPVNDPDAEPTTARPPIVLADAKVMADSRDPVRPEPTVESPPPSDEPAVIVQARPSTADDAQPIVPQRRESPVKLVEPLRDEAAEADPGIPEEIERPNRVRTPPAGVARGARARSPSPAAVAPARRARTVTNEPPDSQSRRPRTVSPLDAPASESTRAPSSESIARPARAQRSSGPIDPADLPTAIAAAPTPWAHRIAGVLPWLVIIVPALYQLFLLSVAITARVTYPYDLEWMEGGMLHHAMRIQNGEGIYVPPSIDFIPYLYTPLYPSLLAMLGQAFGITYALGRVISVLSLIGIAIVSALQIGGPRHEHARRGPAWAGVVLALGLFSSTYPFVEGWFDLVRADTLFLFMVTAGIAGLPRWARTRKGFGGHGQVAAGAALMALAFFCKQTGFFYVAFGGLIVLLLNWRRAFTYAAMAGLIGLGGTWMLDRTTQGWFWTYVSEIHRAHDFNMDRFWKSFGNILWHIPALSIVVGVGLVVVVVTAIAKRQLPRGAHPLLLWSSAFAVSTLVGAIGWGTEFAHFNAYMPAFLHGSLAAGAAIPAIFACARLWWGDRRHRDLGTHVIALGAAVPLALACWSHRWDPHRFTPKPSDITAGERLVNRLRSIEGEIWMPSHPWYLELAGHTPHVHRMGVKDVTTRQTRTVEGLLEALHNHVFTALVLDDRDLQLEIPEIRMYYRPAFELPKDERPHVYTGANVTPTSIWIPAIPAMPPKGAKVIADFEALSWDGWSTSGGAWGKGPVGEALSGQDLVLGATGQRFATSMHTGDAATGRLISPVFGLEGSKLTLRLGGGTDATKLRIELWIDDAIVKTVSVAEPGGDRLRGVTIELGALRGKIGKLVFVDDSTVGHLDVDDVWLWP